MGRDKPLVCPDSKTPTPLSYQRPITSYVDFKSTGSRVDGPSEIHHTEDTVHTLSSGTKTDMRIMSVGKNFKNGVHGEVGVKSPEERRYQTSRERERLD